MWHRNQTPSTIPFATISFVCVCVCVCVNDNGRLPTVGNDGLFVTVSLLFAGVPIYLSSKIEMSRSTEWAAAAPRRFFWQEAGDGFEGEEGRTIIRGEGQQEA